MSGPAGNFELSVVVRSLGKASCDGSCSFYVAAGLDRLHPDTAFTSGQLKCHTLQTFHLLQLTQP